jgi:ribonuclease HI
MCVESRGPRLTNYYAPDILVYTDGACLGRTVLRPGGWAALILNEGNERVIVGSHPATTITAMELTAVVGALEGVPPGSHVTLKTDCAPIVVGITERLPWWRSRGWRTVKGRKVPDRELWQQLAELNATRRVNWVWVKGHSGNADNERVDKLAREQAKLIDQNGVHSPPSVRTSAAASS